MVLLKILSLCNKGTLICLRADNSGYVVFLCVFAVCPEFDNGRGGAVRLKSKANKQGAWLPFLLLILTSCETCGRSFYPSKLLFFPFHPICRALNLHSPSDRSWLTAAVVWVPPTKKPSSPMVLRDAVSQLRLKNDKYWICQVSVHLSTRWLCISIRLPFIS